MQLRSKFPAVLSTCLFFLKTSDFAAAALAHTITSATDVAVTESNYTAEGSLDLALGFTPPPGTNLTVVRNTGTAFITGTFENVPQGATVPLVYNGVTYNYIANYYGGNGRSLVLHWPLTILCAWGDNSSSQLGVRDRYPRRSPIPVAVTDAIRGKSIISTTAGYYHSLALTSDGELVGWGSSLNGELGNTSSPIDQIAIRLDTSGLPSGERIIAIEAGGSSSHVLMASGRVFGWGFNGQGQLGNGLTTRSNTPVAADTSGALNGKIVVSISNNYYHTLALSSDGQIFAWGLNDRGQLGNNSTANSPVPVAVDMSGALDGKTVVAISAGYQHSLAITSDGLVFSWGGNASGQLGSGNTVNSLVPVNISQIGPLAGKTVLSVAAGFAHSIAFTSTRETFAWGANGGYQLGDNSNTASPVPVSCGGTLATAQPNSVAAGNAHSLALSTDGQIQTWGSNYYGQIGNNLTSETPQQIPAPVPTLGPSVAKAVIQADVGADFCLAIVDAGPPVLTNAPVDKTASPGASVTFSSTADHPFPVFVRWQTSVSGPAGPFTDITDNPTAATETLTLTGVTQEMNGREYRAVFHNCSGSRTTQSATLTVAIWNAAFSSATDIPHQVKGAAVSGTLNPTLSFQPSPGTNLTVIRNTGPSFIEGTFANIPQGGIVPLTFNGITYDYVANYYGGNGRSLVLHWPCTGLTGWGYNSSGILGDIGNTGQQFIPVNVPLKQPLEGKTIVAISSTSGHVLALTSEGKVYAWGQNSSGQLGNNSNTASNMPVPTSEFGDLVGKTVVGIAAGTGRSLALTSEGRVYSWGGIQPGSQSTGNNPVPTAMNPEGNLAYETVVSVAIGSEHELALTSKGNIYAWGSNDSGNLGDSTYIFRTKPELVGKGAMGEKPVIAIAAGGSHSLALTLDGKAYAWGSGTEGERGDSNSPQPGATHPVPVDTSGVLSGKFLTAIAATANRSMSLSSDGSLFAWGRNWSGELGNGSTMPSNLPTMIDNTGVLAGKSIISFSAGESHSMAISTDGQVFSWGNNGDGQLGDLTWTARTAPVAVSPAGAMAGRKANAVTTSSWSASLALIGLGPPTLVRHPLNHSAGPGATVSFKAAATNPFPVTVKWQVSANGPAGPFLDIQGNSSASSTELILPNLSVNQNGSAYRAIFRNAAGESTSSAAILTVSPWNAVFTSPTDVSHEDQELTISGILPIQLDFAPESHTNLTILKNTGPALIHGEFDNLPQGTRITLHYNGTAYDFIANYYGGNGRSLVLQWPWIKLAACGSGNTTPALVDPSGALAGKALFGICAGDSHNLAVTSEGGVFAWGSNNSGQLGINNTATIRMPTAVDTTGVLVGKTVVAAAGGGSHSLALTTDGRVFSWGSNFSRQLGNNSSADSMVPVAVDTSGVLAGRTVVTITAGASHSLALDSDGRVYSWGSNSDRQLGNGGWQNSQIPVAVVTSGAMIEKTVVAIAAGGNHSMALSSDGQVFTWGSNSSGQLGNNGTANSSVPVKVNTDGALAGKTVVAIAAGAKHCMALTSDGRVFTWGYNEYGQLGNNSTTNSAVPVAVVTSGVLAGKSTVTIAAGASHGLAITSDGQAVAWGFNSSGQLGNGTTTSSPVPVSVNSSGVLAGGKPVALSAGTSHSLMLFGSGGGPAVTANPVSSSVIQGNSPTNLPVSFSAAGTDIFPFAIQWQFSPTGSAGPFSDITGNPSATTGTLVLPGVTTSENGYAYRMTLSNSGGTGTTRAATLSVTSATSPLTYVTGTEIPFSAENVLVSGSLDIALGFAPIPGTDLTIVRNTGAAFISGQFSNLPQGATIPLTYGGVTHSYVVNYFAGNGRSLMLQWALTKVASWGAGASGQLGNNSTATSKLPVLVNSTGVLVGKTLSAMAAGSNHGLAITPNGEIFAWGANASGQLGDNSTTNRTMPVAVDATGELAGKFVIAVAAGDLHSLALTLDGRVFAWGSNNYGRLGNSSTTSSTVAVAVTNSGVLSGRTINAIAAGSSHSLALASDGRVFAWGLNTSGQLGNLSNSNNISPVEVFSSGVLAGKTVAAIAAGTSHSLALTSDGRVYGWGSNQAGQLGVYSLTSSSEPVAVNGSGLVAGKTVTAIAAGANHSLALTKDGKVYAWGFGFFGQLGNGSTYNMDYPQAVVTSGVLSGKSVVSIAAGGNHSLAVTSEGKAYAWGSNTSGQIGNNSFNDPVASPTAVVSTSGAVATRKVLGIWGGGTHSLALVAAGIAPSVAAHPANSMIPAAGNVTFSATADGGYPVPTVRWQQSATGPGGTFSNITGNATATTPTLELTAVPANRNGYAYRAVFTNLEASVNSTPATLTVIPPPALTLPGNLVAEATGKIGTVVEFVASANDSLDGALVPTCNPPSGTVFPIGTTAINCSVTNSLGQTSTGSFTVTVRRSYASFIDLYGISQFDPLADPYLTGINNLTAYAFGMDPTAPDRSGLPAVSVENGHLQISYTRWKDAADLSSVVEVSDNNQVWRSGSQHTLQVSVTSINATRELVIERDLTPVTAAAKRFMRVRIVK